MVVMDCLSKYAHFIALKHPYTALTVVKVFMAQIVRLHGYQVLSLVIETRFFSVHVGRLCFSYKELSFV